MSNDLLADMGHLGGFQWTVLDNAPPQLSLALEADSRGCSRLELVPAL